MTQRTCEYGFPRLETYEDQAIKDSEVNNEKTYRNCNHINK